MPRSVRLIAVPILATGLIAMPIGGTAQAAASHFNTDPYTTGCSKSSWTLAQKAVSGGTMYIKVSRNCGTNWVEYRGNRQTVTKTGKDHKTNRWTRTEIDTLPFSYSMQSYAPGVTAYTGRVTIGRTTTTAVCASSCSWKVTTTPAPTTTLSAKVDAFVAKYNGRYVDYDGYYGAQCVDLFNFYNRDVVRAKFAPVGYAAQLWNTHDTSRYTRISASSTPRKGDVAVWKTSYPGGGGYGHVAIVLSTSGTTFTALSQNPGATRKITFTKSYVAGYLRPKS